MPRRYIAVEEQRIIIDRAQKRCEYCQSWMNYATQPFVFEHIIPRSRGGVSALENLALACGGCNGHKYNKMESPDPIDGKVVPLYNPRQQKWQDHFGWNEDYTRVVGLTATGRATVKALKMNRPAVMNMRKLLRAAGKHPPSTR
ncbi:MAG: HNH endonuclease [Chloroflexi bacterium]|nr:HNH endonuclease [Chloroflexota bacterium]